MMVRASQSIPPRGRRHDRRPKGTAAQSQAVAKNGVAHAALEGSRIVDEGAAPSCGYEDANDRDRLGADPAFKLACE